MTNRTAQHAVKAEARRLFDLPKQQARQAFSDRVARAYLFDGDAHLVALDFNARLATELRLLADAHDVQTMWVG